MLEVRIVQQESHLDVLVWGQYSMEEAIDRFPGVILTCRLTGVDKVLIDYTRLKGDMAAIQKVIYAMEIIDLYEKHLSSRGRPLQIAWVGAPDKVSSYEPGAELAERQGYPFRLFRDTAEAMEWLGLPPPEPA
jgi:hypothetical protein